jgi:hypothetical protein
MARHKDIWHHHIRRELVWGRCNCESILTHLFREKSFIFNLEVAIRQVAILSFSLDNNHAQKCALRRVFLVGIVAG